MDILVYSKCTVNSCTLLYERVYVTKHEIYEGRKSDYCDGAAVTRHTMDENYRN